MPENEIVEQGGSAPIERIIYVVDRLGGRIVGLLGWIVALTFIVFAAFAGVYVYALFSLPESSRRADALQNIERTTLLMWDKIIPIAETALRVIAPVIVLLLAIAVLSILARKGAAPFDVSKVVSDLPSVLAMVIVATICLLPLSGLPVPDVLSNVALVVVGFYFGKRTANGHKGEQ